MRIFFDVSDIVTYIREHRRVSGIQRAAVEIIAATLHQSPPDTVYLSFWHPGQKTYLCCPAATLIEALTRFDVTALSAAFGVPRKRPDIPAQFLSRYQGKPVKQAVHIARMKLAGQRGQARYFTRRGLDFALWQDLYGPQDAAAPTLAFRPFADLAERGDALCGLGAIWGRAAVLADFRAAATRGVRVFMLVHDLIPLKLPHLADPRATRSYHQWLSEAAGYCAGFLANSNATAADLRAFLAEQGCDTPVHVTQLAQASVTPEAGGLMSLSPQVYEACTLPYVLCVGTIEPRKNLWRLAQVWARLARQDDLELPRLVLAGKQGWRSDGFMAMLAQTGGMGGWVIHLDAPSDAELDHLYRGCSFTATVSLYEGWGLPIGESLSYGKTGLVSQSASMPEVGGDLVQYCDPASMQDMARAATELLRPARRADLEDKIAQTTLRRWADVGVAVIAALRAPG